jgi:hypothetical protein
MCADTSWWTDAHAAWTEAIALILIFGCDFWLALRALEERRENREERKEAEKARQRSEITCAGTSPLLRSSTPEEFCEAAWRSHFHHPGFAFEKTLYPQLPEFLRIKCEPFLKEIVSPIQQSQGKLLRILLVFRFPYPRYDAVLEDVRRLNFGDSCIIWNEAGKPIENKGLSK